MRVGGGDTHLAQWDLAIDGDCVGGGKPQTETQENLEDHGERKSEW